MSTVIQKESVIVIALLAAMIIDSILSNLVDVIMPIISAPVRLAIFSVIAGIALSAGIILVRINTKKIQREIDPSMSFIFSISKAMTVIQYIISGLIAGVVVQSIVSGTYLTAFLSAAITLSYMFAGILQAILAHKFIKWHRYNKSTISLLYLASSAILSIMMILTIIAQSVLLHQSYPYVVTIDSQPEFPIVEGILGGLIQFFLTVPYMLYPAWLLTSWGAATLMLKKYATVVGLKTFVVLISAILFVILLGTLVVYWPSQNLGPFDPTLIAFRLISISSIIIEGLLLGFVFILVSRNSPGGRRSNISAFTGIASYGIAVLFVSGSANLAYGSFPPFSAVAWSFAALGSYLFLLGIYSSAVHVSTDSHIKKSIRKILIDRSGFIDSMVAANIDLELEKNIISIVRKEHETINDKTGFNMQMNDSEIKGYLQELMIELRKEEQFGSEGKGR